MSCSNLATLSKKIEAKLNDFVSEINLLKELVAEFKSQNSKLESQKQLLQAENGLKAAKFGFLPDSFGFNAKCRLDAQSQLGGARAQLETAQGQLEAVKAEDAIDGNKLEVARTSLEATKQMNVAERRFESSKTLKDVAAANESDWAVNKDDRVAKLIIRIAELEADNSTRETKTAQLEYMKLSIETELSERKLETGRLFEKVKEMEKQLDESRKDKQTMQINLLAEVIDLKRQIDRCSDEKKAMQDENEKIKSRIFPLVRRYGEVNPKVYFDMTASGVPTGRIVIELDSKSSPLHLINYFCALCTGENGMDFRGVPLCYKGTTIKRMQNGYYIVGGGNTVGKKDLDEFESIYSSYDQYDTPRSAYKQGDLIVPFALRPDGRFFFSISVVEIYIAAKTMQHHVKIGRLIEGIGVLSDIRRTTSYSQQGSVVITDCGELP